MLYSYNDQQQIKTVTNIKTKAFKKKSNNAFVINSLKIPNRNY